MTDQLTPEEKAAAEAERALFGTPARYCFLSVFSCGAKWLAPSGFMQLWQQADLITKQANEDEARRLIREHPEFVEVQPESEPEAPAPIPLSSLVRNPFADYDQF